MENNKKQNEEAQVDAVDMNTAEDEDMIDVYVLTDEDGNEREYELLAEVEYDGERYVALFPLDASDEEESYGVLKEEEENGEKMFVTIDDDEVFDRVSEIFDDILFNEVDCD